MLKFGDGKSDALMIDNALWLDELRYIPFLRDIGRHFSINRMLTQESVRLRLEREQPLSFLEFNYMLLQAYDYLELHRRHGCRLQMGGSDQWGNIIMGVELGRRVAQADLFALTTPLLTTSAGAKMGKTAAGAVWLNADMLEPLRLLAILAECRRCRCRALPEALHRAAARGDRTPRTRWGAASGTRRKKFSPPRRPHFVHGRSAAETAAETARKTFEEGARAEGLPTLKVSRAKLKAGVLAANLLHDAGLAASTSEARRQIKAGGARLNDRPFSDVKAVVTLADLGSDGTLKLSLGKKRHVLVRAE